MTIPLSKFTGTWQLERRIEDLIAQRVGTLLGVAVFTPDQDGLVYQERGELVFPDRPPMVAERSYLWRATGERIDVLFADARPFHSFDATDPAPQAHHDCAPDCYDVVYDFTGWPMWSSEWHVKGPRKDYVMHSRYMR